ncbi:MULTISPECIES: hypothetical protein [unclassified Streptomyces]|uniref:hypothetical protein n=1 Tax=unclassified Streptomyces TaxID=2593676 RepID=UPI002E2DFDBF|nr:hypothetical protein [Streptomyces sp. NBC_01429]
MKPVGWSVAVRTALSLLVSVVTAMTVTAPSAVAVGGQDAQGICQIRTDVSHTDHVNKTFTKDLYCENVTADVYVKSENYATVNAKLTSTLSWFVCWETGELHAGGNRIWYYTQGDKILNWPLRKGWGYVPAYRLTTTTDPFPGLPACTPDNVRGDR